MAGSYRHCVDNDGNFLDVDFTDMIENLGDAYEACEMMVWMIKYLAEESEAKIQEAEKAFYTRVK